MPNRSLLPALCIVLFFLLLACGDSGSTGPSNNPPPAPVDNTPASLSATTSTSLSGPVGSSVPAGVRVTTATGKAVAGASVQFTVTAGGGSVQASAQTDAGGNATATWQLGTAVGQNTLTARIGQLTPVQFSAAVHAGPPAFLQAVLGMDQAGPAGTSLAFALVGEVTDAFGNATPDVPLTFQVLSGGGELLGVSQKTDVTGYGLASSWRLGPNPGTQTAQLQVAGFPPLEFSATAYAADSPFDMEVAYADPDLFTASQKAAIAAAVTRIRSFVTASLPPVNVNVGSYACNEAVIPPINQTVQNVLVFFYQVDFSTHPLLQDQTTLAAKGGGCGFRWFNNNTEHRTMIIGEVMINTQSIQNFEETGMFERMVTHELLHVLGFGTMWDGFPGTDLREMVSGRGTNDPRFNAPGAIAAFGAAPGNPYGAIPVPVEPGNDSHWRASVFSYEMMSRAPFNQGGTPISSTTIASIGDLGYSVETARSDQHLFPTPGFPSPLDRIPGMALGTHGPIILDATIPVWDGKTGRRIR